MTCNRPMSVSGFVPPPPAVLFSCRFDPTVHLVSRRLIWSAADLVSCSFGSLRFGLPIWCPVDLVSRDFHSRIWSPVILTRGFGLSLSGLGHCWWISSPRGSTSSSDLFSPNGYLPPPPLSWYIVVNKLKRNSGFNSAKINKNKAKFATIMANIDQNISFLYKIPFYHLRCMMTQKVRMVLFLLFRKYRQIQN